MVYKTHKVWRDKLGIGAGWQDIPKEYGFEKHLRNLRRSHPRIPYTLEIECTDYWGSFEREFLAYSIGILDDVQMDIRHSEEELEMFWSEVFGKASPDFETALEEYELLRDYLFETFQECDDWEQLTFYSIDWDTLHKNKRNVLKVQLAKPLSPEWEDIIIPRMFKFFEKHIYEYLKESTKLITIKLLDSKGQVVKGWF